LVYHGLTAIPVLRLSRHLDDVRHQFLFSFHISTRPGIASPRPAALLCATLLPSGTRRLQSDLSIDPLARHQRFYRLSAFVADVPFGFGSSSSILLQF
jgi:hypothetical protein